MAAGANSGSRGPKLLLVGIAAAFVLFIGSILGLAVLVGASPGCGGGSTIELSREVPKRLVPIYDEASAKYRLGSKGPAILASINFNETGFGTNMNNTTGSGAEGWMMFMPETWATWGVDGDGDGDKDPFDPVDAIFSAANYLRDSGAPQDWSEAVFAYNHAGWYVDRVLEDARRFARDDSAAPGRGESECLGAATAPNEAVARMLAEAERLSRLRPQTEYVWGGSHGLSPTPRDGPFDCSSAVSHLLQVGGFKNPTMDTVALSTWGKPGAGQWVTIWVKAVDDEDGPAHTFIEFRAAVAPASERYWGTSGFVAPGHGPGFIAESVFYAEYLAGFEPRHPPKL